MIGLMPMVAGAMDGNGGAGNGGAGNGGPEAGRENLRMSTVGHHILIEYDSLSGRFVFDV